MTGHLELQSYLAAVEMERFVKVNVGISHIGFLKVQALWLIWVKHPPLRMIIKFEPSFRKMWGLGI